jgi:hypothetical protein
MEERIRQRLDELRVERDRGQRHLELLERQKSNLVERLLKIDGAIQVVEELLEGDHAHVPAEGVPAGL